MRRGRGPFATAMAHAHGRWMSTPRAAQDHGTRHLTDSDAARLRFALSRASCQIFLMAAFSIETRSFDRRGLPPFRDLNALDISRRRAETTLVSDHVNGLGGT